jgi:cyclopropane fatty-acyl-phospholipid synthase-like methyltransferase
MNSQVSSSDVVLELGCSYGMATNMLAEHAAAVIGIDNSEEVVAEVSRFQLMTVTQLG